MLRRRLLALLVVLATPFALFAAGKGGKAKGDGLTQKEIVTVIESHNDDARACYEEALAKDKMAEGKVKIRFLIGLNGKVEASETEQNTFKDKGMSTCLRAKMKTWSFPKPRGEERVSIAYPFEFKTVPAPAAPPATEAAASPAPTDLQSPAPPLPEHGAKQE